MGDAEEAKGAKDTAKAVKTPVDAGVANASSQVGASSCESAPTPGEGSAADAPDQVMGDAEAAQRAKDEAKAAKKALAKEKMHDAAVRGTGGDIGDAMNKAMAVQDDPNGNPVDYSDL